MLRSTERLQKEIKLRQQIDALIEEEPAEGWDQYARRRNRRGLADVQRALSQVGGDLEWTFDGAGIYDHAITMARLVAVAEPLGQTLRWAARDLLFLEGKQVNDTKELVEPVVTGTVEGSFGLRISRPPVAEQPSLEGTLFERTAARVVSLFQAARSDDAQQRILVLVGGFRANTLSGLKKLTSELAESGRPSQIRWQGQTVLTVMPVDANVVYETISHVVPSETELTIRGILVGGDTDKGTFHIRVPGRPHAKDYSGKAEPSGAQDLKGIPLDAEVEAGLVVVVTDSPLLAEPKETYVLRRIEVKPMGAIGQG